MNTVNNVIDTELPVTSIPQARSSISVSCSTSGSESSGPLLQIHNVTKPIYPSILCCSSKYYPTSDSPDINVSADHKVPSKSSATQMTKSCFSSSKLDSRSIDNHMNESNYGRMHESVGSSSSSGLSASARNDQMNSNLTVLSPVIDASSKVHGNSKRNVHVTSPSKLFIRKLSLGHHSKTSIVNEHPCLTDESASVNGCKRQETNHNKCQFIHDQLQQTEKPINTTYFHFDSSHQIVLDQPFHNVLSEKRSLVSSCSTLENQTNVSTYFRVHPLSMHSSGSSCTSFPSMSSAPHPKLNHDHHARMNTFTEQFNDMSPEKSINTNSFSTEGISPEVNDNSISK